MLKKVMIICLVLSFVFIGGIAFASGGTTEEPVPSETPVIEQTEPTEEEEGTVVAPEGEEEEGEEEGAQH